MDVVSKLGLDKLNIRDGLLNLEAEALAFLVRKVPFENPYVADVGSWKGFSCAILASEVKPRNGHVVAVDHWRGNCGTKSEETAKAQDILGIFKGNMEILGLADTVSILSMPSSEALRGIKDDTLALAFLDADHHYTSVKADIEGWMKKVKVGGILCGHDCEGYYSRYSVGEKEEIDSHLEVDYYNCRHSGVIRALFDCFNDIYGLVPYTRIWFKERTIEKQDLINFEADIKEFYLQGKIRAPVHLVGGNEELLISIFREVKPEDWVFSTYRSHYHAILKGVPKKEIREEILAGHSMHLNFKDYNFFTSSIASGCVPIALGVALAIKLKGENRKVWCFIGDMMAEMGITHECIKYAMNHNLPIVFCIEDNGFSVETPTAEAWGLQDSSTKSDKVETIHQWEEGKVIKYHYSRMFPHQGVGKWIAF